LGDTEFTLEDGADGDVGTLSVRHRFGGEPSPRQTLDGALRYAKPAKLGPFERPELNNFERVAGRARAILAAFRATSSISRIYLSSER
jgi:hypothetical protein